MLEVILMVVFGFVVALFATQNTAGVTVVLANAPVPGVPLYMVVIASILIGLVVGWIFNLFGSISSFFSIKSRDNAIAGKNQSLNSLNKRVNELERENDKLRIERDNLRPSIKERLTSRT